MRRLLLILAVAVSVNCATEGDTCDDPFEVDSFPYERRVDLGAMQPDMSFRDEPGPCVPGRQSGEDAVFAVELSAGQTLMANMTCSFDGASLYAVFNCDASLSPSQCIDGGSGEYAGNPIEISFAADADSTAFVVADHGGPPLISGGDHVCDVQLHLQ